MASEKRLIDANALYIRIAKLTMYVVGVRYGKSFISRFLEGFRDEILKAIEDAPTVDAEPVVHAYWMKEQDEHGIDRGWKCSNCRGSVYEMTYEPYNGCPHCRAKMDGDGNA